MFPAGNSRKDRNYSCKPSVIPSSIILFLFSQNNLQCFCKRLSNVRTIKSAIANTLSDICCKITIHEC